MDILSVGFDYESINSTLSVFAGGTFAPVYVNLNAYEDGSAEEVEGFVIVLSLLDTELDSRDVGQVNISRSIYLIRINQSGITLRLLAIIKGTSFNEFQNFANINLYQ